MKLRRSIINALAMLIICGGTVFLGAPEAKAQQTGPEICVNDNFFVVADWCECGDEACYCTGECDTIVIAPE